MKNIIYSCIFFIIISCTENNKNVDGSSTADSTITSSKLENQFGEKINGEGAISVDEMKKLMVDGKAKEFIIKGKITEVCQQKGCWAHLDDGTEESLMVTFKDYGFFLPKDCSGKEAVMKGIASIKTISVEDQKHYALDEGKTEEEIALIVQPKTNIVFEAAGVILR